MVTQRSTSSNIENDLNMEVLAEAESYPANVIEWFYTGSTPRPGTPLKKTAGVGGDVIVNPPTVGIYDPDCNWVAELDKNQIATCSVAYTAGDRIPCINLRKIRGGKLRNIVCKSTASAINAETYFCAVSDTTGKYDIMIDMEVISISGASVGTAGNSGGVFQKLGSSGAQTLLYASGSTGKALKYMPKLTNVYYTVSPGADYLAVMEVL